MNSKKTIFTLFTLFLLAGCSTPTYQKPVDLTPEELTQLQEKAQEERLAIDNYESKEGEIPELHYIALADAYVEMGEYGKAIEVYLEPIGNDKPTRAIVHNLGRLYEEVEEYDKAVDMYQFMIDHYKEPRYYSDIAFAYVNAGDPDKAQEAYDQWIEVTGNKDASLEQRIELLREGS